MAAIQEGGGMVSLGQLAAQSFPALLDLKAIHSIVALQQPRGKNLPVPRVPRPRTICGLRPPARHPDPLGSGERVPAGLMRESMRSVEEIGAMTVKAMGESEITAGMKGFLMPERAMAEARAKAETKFHPVVMSRPMTGAKVAATSRPPNGCSWS